MERLPSFAATARPPKSKEIPSALPKLPKLSKFLSGTSFSFRENLLNASLKAESNWWRGGFFDKNFQMPLQKNIQIV